MVLKLLFAKLVCCVCEGFATSFQKVMSKLGFYSVRIEGDALNSKNEIQSHSWNVVQKDKQWYLVDFSYDILHNLNDVQLFFLRILNYQNIFEESFYEDEPQMKHISIFSKHRIINYIFILIFLKKVDNI